MAIDTDALKLREIDREGQFTPFAFGDAAKSAVSTGLQLQQVQEKSAATKQKREQAAMMQQLINGGQQALFSAIDKLEPEEQNLILGGDRKTLQSITTDPEGLVNGWKMLSEVLGRKEGGQAEDFSGKVGAFGRRGLISAKDELSLTKPSAEKGEISNTVFLEVQQTVEDRIKALEQTPTKDAIRDIALAAFNEKGIPVNDPGAAKLMQFLISSSATPESPLITQKFEKQKDDDRIKRISELSKNLRGSADQGKIFLGLAEDLDLFSDKPVNILQDREFQALQGKFIDTQPQSLLSAFMTEKLGASPKDQEQAKIIRELRKPENRAIFKGTRFANIVTKFSKLINVLTKARSGAAVTPNELERIKTEFGIDLLGSPEQFKIGLINFGRDLKFSMEQVEAGTSPKAVSTFRKRGGFTSSNLDFTSSVDKRRSRIEELEAKAAE